MALQNRDHGISVNSLPHEHFLLRSPSAVELFTKEASRRWEITMELINPRYQSIIHGILLPQPNNCHTRKWLENISANCGHFLCLNVFKEHALEIVCSVAVTLTLGEGWVDTYVSSYGVWWRHDMEARSALLAPLCGDSTGHYLDKARNAERSCHLCR